MLNTRAPAHFVFQPIIGHMSVLEATPAAPAWEQALRRFGARFFEASPGAVTWILLGAPAWIPIVFKLPGAIVVAWAVLVFDAYWVVRAVTVVIGVYSSLFRMQRDMKRDWLQACRQDHAAESLAPLQFLRLCVVPTSSEPHHALKPTQQASFYSTYPYAP